MAKFIPYDYNQSAMVVINFNDQIQMGTFEHALHHLVDNKLDLSCFADDFKNDDNGRPAYDPAILLKIILFAYSKGITSSREIAWCCRSNIIFMALSCQSTPHFTTIADFISGNCQSIESLFEQVLLVCDQQGLLGNELFAIDGCKMPSNAAKEFSGTHQELKTKRDKIKHLIQHHTHKHQQQDLLDDKAEADNETQAQQARHQQAIDTLNKAADKIERFLNNNEPRMGKGKRTIEVKSNITDNESAKMTTSKGTIQGYNGIASVDKKHQIIIGADAFGEGQEHHTLQPILKGIQERYKKLKLSDDILSEGTVVTADTGFANEDNMRYLHENEINAYIPDNKFRSRDPKFDRQKKKYPRASRAIDPTINITLTSKDFNFDPIKQTCVCPAGQTLSHRGIREDNRGSKRIYFTGRTTQCRACKLKAHCMKNPSSADHGKGNGRQVSFILSKKPTHTDWMKHRVDSDKGKRIYSHRMSVVEPVFGNLEFNKKLTRFTLRGLKKINAQWKLFCLIQNIEKLANYGTLAA
jgi:transposase